MLTLYLTGGGFVDECLRVDIEFAILVQMLLYS